MRALDLVNLIASDLGQTARDNMLQWVREALGMIGELNFPWNRKEIPRLTFSAVQFLGTSGSETFAWSEGDNFIICTGSVITFADEYTGRKVMLGDEVYRIIDIGMTSTTRIYVDRPIRGSASLQTPWFFRDEYCYRTAKIHDVRIDRYKYPQVSDYTKVNQYYANWHLDVGAPSFYVADDNASIPAPEYPPVISGTTGTAMQDGKYYYFFTRYDEESGLESDPGPVLEYQSTSANFPIIKYANTGNLSENTTYKFRLWRSQRNPKDRNPPMFLIGSRTGRADVGITDDNATYPMRNKVQYDWSKQTVVRLCHPPDTQRRSLIVQHNAGYGKRLWDDEIINLGTNNAVLEIIRMHCKACSKIQDNDVQGYRTQVASFRRQLEYLLTTTRAAGESDLSDRSHRPFTPGFCDDDSGSWVERMSNFNMDE